MRRPLAERAREVTIDFDHVQLAARCEQGEGERAAPGPDLHDQLAGPRGDGVDDAPHHRTVVEEVLSEPLAGIRLARRWDPPAGAGGAAAHGSGPCTDVS